MLLEWGQWDLNPAGEWVQLHYSYIGSFLVLIRKARLFALSYHVTS
jgi:hypothetical protein